MVCAAIGQTLGSLAGRHLRQAARRARPAAALRQRRRRRPRRRHRARALLGRRRGAPLPPAARPSCATTPRTRRSSRALNEELPPHRLIDTLAQIDPFAALAGPAAGVERARPGRARLARREQLRRSASCASSATPAGSGSRARAGSRATASSSPTPTSLPEIDTPHVDRNDGALLDAQVVSFDKTNDVAVLRVAGLARAAAAARRRRAGDARRAARLPGQRPLRRDGRPRRPHRADRRPRRVRQLPGQPQGDDDSRRRFAAATRAGRSSMRRAA